MELDKRIKDISTIQTILRYDVNCIGCKGYFFDEFVDIKDLSRCCRYGELVNITTDCHENDLCFKAKLKSENTNFFRFFISEADLKPVEKKYRAYTLAEWIDQHEIGDVVKFRNSKGQEFHVLYTGYIFNTNDDIQDTRTKGQIMFMSVPYSFQELFANYEICVYGEWQPFGIIEEGEE